MNTTKITPEEKILEEFDSYNYIEPSQARGIAKRALKSYRREVLENYSQYLEINGYTDSDWREEDTINGFLDCLK